MSINSGTVGIRATAVDSVAASNGSNGFSADAGQGPATFMVVRSVAANNPMAKGSDANSAGNCHCTTPCRTFATAHANTFSDNGRLCGTS